MADFFITKEDLVRELDVYLGLVDLHRFIIYDGRTPLAYLVDATYIKQLEEKIAALGKAAEG